MIIDTSAIMAIVRSEADHEKMARILAENRGRVRMSVGNWIELEAVLSRSGDTVTRAVAQDVIEETRVRFEPVSIEQGEVARAAYRKFGRGSQAAAKLNFGDCFAYALAKVSGEPLLYKGDDFVHTDIVAAV